MHPSLQRTWDRDDVVAGLRESLDIVEELEPPDDLRGATFGYVVQLVTQVAQRVSVGSIALPTPPAG